MLYHIIRFKDGKEEKCPIDKWTEDEIRAACLAAGREVEDIRQAEVEDKPKNEKVVKFEVRMSFDDTKNLFVTAKELPFVYFAMENNTIIYIAGGAIRGQNIIDVTPDYNSYMGWNRGYEPNSEDYALLQPHANIFRDIMAESKQLVRLSAGDQSKLVNEIRAATSLLKLEEALA